MEEGSFEQAVKDGQELAKPKTVGGGGGKEDILSRIKAQIGKYLEVGKGMEESETRNCSNVVMTAQVFYRENN